jgi:hypothetical protein
MKRKDNKRKLLRKKSPTSMSQLIGGDSFHLEELLEENKL